MSWNSSFRFNCLPVSPPSGRPCKSSYERSVANALCLQKACIDEATSQIRTQIRELENRSDAIQTEITGSIESGREAARNQGDALSRMGQDLSLQLAQVGRGVYPPVLLGGHNDVLATEVDGLIIGVPSAEWRVAAYLAFRGVLEPGLTALFKQMVRPGMVVVDVGANIGIYTLLGARLLQGHGKVSIALNQHHTRAPSWRETMFR